MSARYELVDTHHPEWRGQRFNSLDRARKARDEAWPPGRFVLIDRTTQREVDTIEVVGFDTQDDFDDALAKWEAEQAGKSNPFLDEMKGGES
jgi:hypothetical protein